MTGGQPVDGPISPAIIARQVAAEGVEKIVVVSDEPDKYPSGYFAAGTAIHHRDDLDKVQRELRDTPGCTVLLYDQTCAAEKRRRRKRGKYPDPAKRVFINELVCEGCGDRDQVELRFRRAGRNGIRPQAHDRSELVQQGFLLRQRLLSKLCHRRGRRLAQAEAGRCARRHRPARSGGAGDDRALRDPGHRHRRHGCRDHRRIAGHGCSPRRQGCSVLDMTGLAQKNGAIVSHVRIADTGADPCDANRRQRSRGAGLRHPDRRRRRGGRQDAKRRVTRALVNTRW